MFGQGESNRDQESQMGFNLVSFCAIIPPFIFSEGTELKERLMGVMVLIIFVFLVLVLFGLGSLIYLSAKGLSHLIRNGGLAEAGWSGTLPRSVRQPLAEAQHYGRLIKRTLRECPPGPLQERLQRLIGPVEEWLANLTHLERGLGKSFGSRQLPREIRQTEFEISKLRRQLLTLSAQETPALRELLASKEGHLSTLRELSAFQNRAELKIRKIATDLGATHAEMTLLLARGDFNENRLNRLDENLREHVSGMRDMLRAMDEMGYSRSSAN
jgi:hypothetical protein